MLQNKRGNVGIVAIVLALLLLVMFLVNLALRDCNSNKDCPENAYCGADNECHAFPESIVVTKNNYIPAALILGISFIIGVILLRLQKFPFKNQ